jgi:hypothetical protein
MGLFLDSGQVSTSTEAWYQDPYNSTCDNYAQYATTSGAVCTTAVSSSEPLFSGGLGWGSCGFGPMNFPYNVAKTGLCSQTGDYWGG